ncbi:MAG: hypothetical protein KDJ31_13475 [Candidatus Competibacteraceae bacterium]|nr:hypothetical protein [Candidatus Competibacteraceae bacterium]MCB1820641.1 hypothetical protein [Candidatus Competibacteraceae bacterium]
MTSQRLVMKSIHRLIAVILFPGTLSACEGPEVDIVPVIPPPPPEVQRHAGGGVALLNL